MSELPLALFVIAVLVPRWRHDPSHAAGELSVHRAVACA